MEVGIEISTSRRVDLRFDDFPDQARSALKQAITGATERLLTAARARAPKRTGRLASLIKSRVVAGDKYITGIVAMTGDFAKAAAEEYGAHNATEVRAHEARLAHLFSRPMTQISVQVTAHSRKLNIQARNYLRGALDEVRSGALSDMEEAVEKAVKE
jgi:hypothetical protein